ncbi:MAG: branched-chain amino acid ABC transporter permease [Halobacteriota archaeon]
MSVADAALGWLDNTDNRYIGALAVVFALALPVLGLGSYYMQVFINIFLYIALVSSWNLIGYTGYINFGQAAFYGLGAYVLGYGVVYLGLPIPVAVVLGGIFAAALGFALGTITLRLRGHYFSIASLMLLFIVTVLITNISDVIPAAQMEIWLPSVDLSGRMFNTVFYYAFLGLAVFMLLFSIWLENTKFGYGLKAIKENEDIAMSLGVPNSKLKTWALTASAFFAGIIGSVHAQFFQYIDASVYFAVTLTFIIVFMGFVGSMGEWYGPLVGVFLFVPVDEALTYYVSPEFGRILYGLLFVIIILAIPQGLGRYIHDWIDEAGDVNTSAQEAAIDSTD